MTKEHEQGREAYQSGMSEVDCPHSMGGESGRSQKRIDWFNGYFEAQIGQRLAGVFERNNIAWP